MCGRFTHLFTWRQLRRLMELTTPPADTNELPKRYNVAPMQSAPVVRTLPGGGRSASMLRWGLIPSWAKDATIAARTINARSETLSEKPAFRTAFKKRRCLIPITGFYEWQKLEPASPSNPLTPPSKRAAPAKQPYYITSTDHEPIVLAGLWESWHDPAADQTQSDKPFETFSILTTSPNELMARFHDRMPVIIARAHFARWLDPAIEDTASLADLFKPYPAELMVATPVSTRVNSPRVDDELCIKPLDQAAASVPPPSKPTQRKNAGPEQGRLF